MSLRLCTREYLVIFFSDINNGLLLMFRPFAGLIVRQSWVRNGGSCSDVEAEHIVDKNQLQCI